MSAITVSSTGSSFVKKNNVKMQLQQVDGRKKERRKGVRLGVEKARVSAMLKKNEKEKKIGKKYAQFFCPWTKG